MHTTHESEERLRLITEAAGLGIWVWHVAEDRVTWENDRMYEIAGLPRTSEPVSVARFIAGFVYRADVAAFKKAFADNLHINGRFNFLGQFRRADGELRWIEFNGRPHFDLHGNPVRVFGTAADVTEREHKQGAAAFLVRLDDAVRTLSDAQEITRTSARLLGEHLHADRVAYCSLHPDQDAIEIHGEYTAAGVASILGRYRLSMFGSGMAAALSANLPFAAGDTEHDPHASDARDVYRRLKIRAHASVPLHKSERLVAAMAVHQSTPRPWRADELELLRQVANRCWESVERARITRELEQREQRYRFLAESIPQMVWTALPNGALDYVNSQGARYFGVGQQSLLDSGWLAWVHPEDVDHTVERWKQSLASGEPYEVSFRLRRHSDGSWRWHLSRAHALLDDSGRIVQWCGTCTDIEDQKQAESRLQKQWITFDTALSHTPDFVYTFDLGGRFTYVNRALLTLWQKPLEEALGKNFFELDYPPELAAHLQAQIQQVIDTKEPVRDHTPFTDPTGQTGHYEYIFVPALSPNGRVQAVAGSTRDITERERIKQALARSEQKLQQVFAQAPVAIVVLRGPDYRVELANAQYESLLQGRELVGRRFADVVPELPQDVWDAFRRVVETGETFTANEWHIPYDYNRDGVVEDHWFNVAYNPLRELDGAVSGLMAVLTDVTAQVVARRELERVNRELEEFAYVASHDLQEPLRMVNIYTQLLLRRIDTNDPECLEFGEIIRQGAVRMDLLIRDLLTYSRTIHVDDAPVGTTDLSSSLGEACSILKAKVEESGAVIDAQPLPVVRADSTQMVQVFQNLLSNAIKYCAKDVVPQIHVRAEPSGDDWLVSVKDNGIGFEPQYAAKIFGLFKRLHKDEYPGTGLGLAICKRLIERFGGRMWATSSPGEGAAFYFTLPRVDEPRA